MAVTKMVFPILTSTSPNSQVDLLLSFCQQLKFSSVVLVGHDDSGLLALMAAANILTTLSPTQIAVSSSRYRHLLEFCSTLLWDGTYSGHCCARRWRPLRKVFVNLSCIVHIASYSGGIQFSHINDKTWYSDTRAYSQSKLANFFHAKELAIRFKAEGVDITANAVHQGFIMTPLMATRFKVEMARAKQTIRRTPPQYLFLNKQIANVRVRSI
ncbi:hypothetical protein SELMODRAFT_423328 [Selaginella moellendorffii]|uniref:Uncharacterized protein n=1 Tax=Selaginella moellendorffii TaxID=88036 RepID=D8SLB4_SELML|nr:hypothetical protein SELMODRAFT_423328 [Selaginella moellendorffii]